MKAENYSEINQATDGIKDASLDEQSDAVIILEAENKLQTITGHRLSGPRHVVTNNLECCINGFLGDDSIVIVKIIR